MNMIYNDIELKSNNDGTYDWAFGYDDVSNVIGNQRLRSNIIHSILLQPYELEQEYYAFKGCSSWDYINEPRTGHVETLLSESMRIEIQKIEGVKDATITLTGEGYNIIPEILLFKDDGTEVLVEWNSEQK